MGKSPQRQENVFYVPFTEPDRFKKNFYSGYKQRSNIKYSLSACR